MKKDSGALEEPRRAVVERKAELVKGFRWPAAMRKSAEYLEEL